MPSVLILGGNGKIGQRSAEAFAAAGWTVRHYDRKTGDMTKAAKGADVIVNGLNPPNYHNWATVIPQITRQVIAAARASGATVIIPGNVYNFGDQPGVFDENTPHLATTRKGRTRIEMEKAYRDSGVQTIILRAGNFIDPDGNGDIMSLFVLRDVAKGKITAGSDPDTLQAYAYVPDWARAAVMLAEKRETLAQFEDIPFEGHSFTINELRNTLARYTGRTFKISRFPWWMMTILSPFWELARELREMRYLYALNHSVNCEKLHRLLPDFQPSSREAVMCAGLPADIHPNQTMRSDRIPLVT
ncbi:NAD-dependent epimerase/dehydratase family protein [Yoonia litorea]|uniref:Nucleoside-diphosphate-sugar epimerase n=1 Tax=Yoonia litorea TaxID=1123755 RepID=A0A1I6L8Q7_9RHOB|nr:NAD-dependent epimerase/dehydratase family protein [Yoonia litorea]SFR99792.1 Nucleoside-diphosphate-sugar epimerase [Yoonia litorea]